MTLFHLYLKSTKINKYLLFSIFQVFVPEQDAAWELEGDQFEDQIARHDRCDAEICVCPNGRHEDEDYTIWEIVSF
jgi:hypothetical protein